MGQFKDGQWRGDDMSFADSDGAFKRKATTFREFVTDDGSSRYPAEAGRYHLYVSYACPWAHRTLIFRKLKGLEDAVSLSVVHYFMDDQGWSFDDGPGVVADPVFGADRLRDVYLAADPNFSGRITVPVLWDKATGTIVNNESSEIIRMFNSAFAAVASSGDDGHDYYPASLRPEIDEVNARVYETVNNGVYKAGFARSQAAYDTAVQALFDTLDWLDNRLRERRYLTGDTITEADWRLFTTLVRFDLVYHGHFKCNRRRLIDYPNLWAYTRDLYQVDGVAQTCNFEHIAKHYYMSHTSVNPSRVVPIGPELNFGAPHHRAELG